VKVNNCVYVKKGVSKEDRISAGTWVDDLIVTAKLLDMDVFELDLKKYYAITSHRGTKVSYISLYIERDTLRHSVVSQ